MKAVLEYAQRAADLGRMSRAELESWWAAGDRTAADRRALPSWSDAHVAASILAGGVPGRPRLRSVVVEYHLDGRVDRRRTTLDIDVDHDSDDEIRHRLAVALNLSGWIVLDYVTPPGGASWLA